MVLFLVDLLGTKARWAAGSLDDIREVYEQFECRIATVLTATPLLGAIGGGIQSDAAAFVFDEAIDAVRFGHALFRATFEAASEQRRLWLRGLIVPTDTPAQGLVEVSALNGFDALEVRHFSAPMLQAINVEQRFKGPRLLVAGELVTDEVQNALAIPVGDLHAIPLRSLDYAPPPDREVAGPWWDVLYLMPDRITEAALAGVDEAVGRCIRWAAQQSMGELAQLSLLSVMWAETQAIARSVGLRAGALERPLG
jgi:hypothetical protein